MLSHRLVYMEEMFGELPRGSFFLNSRVFLAQLPLHVGSTSSGPDQAMNEAGGHHKSKRFASESTGPCKIPMSCNCNLHKSVRPGVFPLECLTVFVRQQ